MLGPITTLMLGVVPMPVWILYDVILIHHSDRHDDFHSPALTIVGCGWLKRIWITYKGFDFFKMVSPCIKAFSCKCQSSRVLDLLIIWTIRRVFPDHKTHQAVPAFREGNFWLPSCDLLWIPWFLLPACELAAPAAGWLDGGQRYAFSISRNIAYPSERFEEK